MKRISVGLMGLCAVGLWAGLSRDAALSPDTASALLDVFPPSVATVAEPGQSRFSFTYHPSGSLWGEGLDEKEVFHAELRHEQDPFNSYALRIGKGGQLYSLRGAFGESVPPQSNGRLSPWNDEVWQFVTVCERYNRIQSLSKKEPAPEALRARFKNSGYGSFYFIHNSGSYVPESSDLSSFYCPMFASTVTDNGRSFRSLNWGLVSQMKSIHRSPVLYYVQTRDVGQGVIELTWVVHNFSVRDDIVFDYLNAPWGGTRRTSLPVHAIASPDGNLHQREVFQKRMDLKAISLRATGGWNLSSVSEADDSPALAFVFGRDKHLEAERIKMRNGLPHLQRSASVYKDWLAQALNYEALWADWESRPEQSFRNYDVVEVAPRANLTPGSTVWFRSYMVVNRKDRAIELAKTLVDQVDYGLLSFDPADTPLLPVRLKNGRVSGQGAVAFQLFSKPVPGSMPLFLIEQRDTGREVITTDPYLFVKKEALDLGVPEDHPDFDYYKDAQGYDMLQHNSQWKALLGYAYVDKPEAKGYVRLSSTLAPEQFPPPTPFNLDLWIKE